MDLRDFEPEVVEKAFWLQEHIRRHGIEGIHFMRDGRKHTEKTAADTLADSIENRLRKL